MNTPTASKCSLRRGVSPEERHEMDNACLSGLILHYASRDQALYVFVLGMAQEVLRGAVPDGEVLKMARPYLLKLVWSRATTAEERIALLRALRAMSDLLPPDPAPLLVVPARSATVIDLPRAA